MKAVLSRLLKLEAAAPPLGRIIPMFVWRKTEAEIAAEQADMVRRGVASPSDTFQVFTWLSRQALGHRACTEPISRSVRGVSCLRLLHEQPPSCFRITCTWTRDHRYENGS